MRITTALLSFGAVAIMFLQSSLVGIGSAIGQNEATAAAGGAGIIVAVLLFLGGALVFAVPRISLVIYIISALICYGAGYSSDFSDLTIWGYACYVLATLSFFCSSKATVKSKKPLLSLVSELESLARLREKGTLDEAQFGKQKAKLLAQM
ncbi:MAG: SHOCT domain-containing protein [Bdellovibrionales bacterium]|nr:SHOCT domain-containing protein [Bdellovibrionales bacterium]